MKLSIFAKQQAIFLSTLIFAASLLSGCGGSDSSETTASYYSIGGTVSGLTGTGLVLQYNGNYDLDITSDGNFTFATSLANGSNYSVTVLTQPTGQTCDVTNGSGILNGADVTNVSIDCVTSFNVGGSISNLAGSGLVLQNNAGDDLSVTSGSNSFTFATLLGDNAAYAVTVKTQPTSLSQTCTVTNGSGTIAAANVTDISISCLTNSFSVSGTVTGLTGTGLVLQFDVSGVGTYAISANSSFTLPDMGADGSNYSVTIFTQPSGQACVVTNGSGTFNGADVTNITVSCGADLTTNTGLYDIVDTNQTLCYNSSSGAIASCTGAGHDADYNGNQPSYTDNGNGTITDNVTGLTWLQSTDTDGAGGIDVNDKLSQTDAINYCSALSTAGLTWRLPNIKELYSLILFSGKDASTYTGSDTSTLTPFIDTTYFDKAFGDTGAGERIIDGQYATTTDYVWTTMGGDATMFGVNFVDGRIKGYPKNLGPAAKTFYVRCVTGNTSYGVNSFTDNGDTTISDAATGLMWQQSDAQSTNWENAISVCESATTGGHTDWRLPNVKELQSILDYTRSPDTTSSAAIDAKFLATSFTNEEGVTDWGYYWASTTHAEEWSTDTTGENATYLSFGRALGYFDDPFSGLTMYDVHGAGAQRSNDKFDLAGGGVSTADLGQGTFSFHGPQGDILRLDNWVRCVRNF